MKKIAVVTGTSSGVGLHLAILLAQRGYTTVATMRNISKQDALLAEAEKQGVSVLVRQLDVQDDDSVQGCLQAVIDEFGQIDLLVNNAGAGYVRSTEQATKAEIDEVFDINLMGVIRCTRAVLPTMRVRRQGHIINISSVGGLVGQPFNELYCAAKFAVEGYTEALATYVQPAFGILFTLIEPGGIRSEFVNNVMEKMNATGGVAEDEYQPILARYRNSMQQRAAAGGGEVYQSSEEVARIVADCAGMEKPPLRLRTSAWAEDLCRYKTANDPDGSLQQQMVIDMFLQGIGKME
ncbi:MAG: SDR family oxidoreductase [Pseudomonadales bacterium]|nr:SDR family oxidoreductase [Pseudomonadales bacterium]